MRFHFNRALGDDSSPFAPCKAHDPYSMIGQLGAANLSMIGNWFSTQDSNQTNRRIARETNEQNYKIWQEQLAAAKEQYRQEVAENRFLVNQAYERNLPINQVKALKEAGINPSLAFDSNAFQNNAVVGQNPTSSVPQAPQMVTGAPNIPVDFSVFGNGVSAAIQSFLASKKNEADISYLKQKGVNETLDTIARIQKYSYENKHLKALTDQVMNDVLFNQENWEVRKEALSNANKLMEADTLYKNTMSDLNKQAIQMNIDQNNRAWIELRQFVAESNSRISLNGHLGQMYDSQAQVNYSQADVNTEIWKDKKFYNSKLEEIYSNNKGQADAMLRKLNYETSVQGWKDFVRMFQGFIPFGGMYQ